MTLDPSEVFRQEARELVEVLEIGLLDLEHHPGDRDLVDGVFRALHTIKGSGAMFGFTEVAEFVHDFETAFDKVRKGEAPATSKLVSVALRGKDHVHALIEGTGVAPETGPNILNDLRAIVGGGGGHAEAAPVEAAPAETVAEGWRIRFKLPADSLAFGANPMLLIEELGEIGTAVVTAEIAAVPGLDVLEHENSYLTWHIQLTTTQPKSAVEDVFMFLASDMELSIDPILAEPVAPPVVEAAPPPPPTRAKPEGGEEGAKSSSSEKAGSSLRVPAERLDELMDRVGELVIAQTRLNRIASASGDPNLKTIAEELERLSSGLRDTTMGIRMVPIGTLFGRFRRLVHDLSRDLGKPIDFVTTGEDTEMDKTVIERLADPLVHIMRNSIDHGFEKPDERARLGKPVEGSLQLSAVYSGAEVAISLSDDGAGLNPDRIRAKGIEQGIIAPDAKVADADLYQLIFHPGFSTAKEVTALSGRGVGMDVVKRTIEGLRGSIDLSTVPGKGTRVTLRLPLTLAIIDGLLVRVGEGCYTIPLSAVEECLELPTFAENPSRSSSFLNVRGSLVPYLNLRDLFRSPNGPEPHQKVVIVSSGEMRVGLVVDQIIGNNQTVIKQLSKLHQGIKNFSGATILGDGTVSLILDVMHLVNSGQAVSDRQAEQEGKAA